MGVEVYSVPGQTQGRRKGFSEPTSIYLYSKLSFACEGNVNYYKSVHHPIPTLPVGIGNTLEIFKTNQCALFWIDFPGIFSSWPKWRGEGNLFWRVQEGRRLWDYPLEHLVNIENEKVCPFVKFEIFLPNLCRLLDLIKKHCRSWSSMINLSVDSWTFQKYRILLSARQRSNN